MPQNSPAKKLDRLHSNPYTDLTFMYTNLCVLHSKFDLFQAYVLNSKPCIIMVTETWLTTKDCNRTYNIPGYTLFRLDRKHKKTKLEGKTKGGGVAMYLKDYVNGIPLLGRLNKRYMCDDVEALYIDVQFSTYHFLVIVVYRSDDNSELIWKPRDTQLLQNIISATENNTVVVAGDFNYPTIKWPVNVDQSQSGSAELFANAFIDSNLYQLVNKPTRYRLGYEPSLLDLIMVNEESLVTDIVHKPPIGKSDHCVLEFSIQCLSQLSGTTTSNRLRRYYQHVNYVKYNEDLLHNLENKYYKDNTELTWKGILNAINMTSNIHAPEKVVKDKFRNKPWIDDNILKLTVEKKALWDKYRQTENLEDYKVFRAVNNKCVAMSRIQRSNFESKILDSGDKSFYSYIRRSTTSKVSIPPAIRNPNGDLVTNPNDIANVFAEEFLKAYSIEPAMSQPPQIASIPRVQQDLCDIKFTAEVVEEAISNLRLQSAPGPDQIPCCIFKNCSESLAPVLAVLMNMSFERGYLPQDWKHAVVTPIYKKGDKTLPSNFRPISLTSIFVRIMEKIISKKLTQFLKAECIIPDRQHGFVEKRSTITNLLSCVHTWSKDLDNGNPVDVCYLDYERAFDRVPHQRLLVKLDHVGIRGPLLRWIENYLTDRTFQVRVGNCLSQSKPVLSGVPQGSVLSAHLFGVYISDLIETVQCKSAFFADDGKFFTNPTMGSGQLQEDLNRIHNWTKEWVISLNISKCCVLHLGKTNPKTIYSLDGNNLQSVNLQKDLGIHIAPNLKWEEHITTIVKKANSFIYIIRRSFQNMTVEVFRKIYKTYIRPLLEYGFQIWNPYFQKDINLLESVQRRATKIPQALRRKSYEDRLKALRLTTLEERRLRGDLIETYKILTLKYDLPELHHIYNLRQGSKTFRGHCYQLTRSVTKSLTAHHFLSNRVVTNWNKLPEDVVTASSTNAFKNKLDKWIKDNKVSLLHK